MDLFPDISITLSLKRPSANSTFPVKSNTSLSKTFLQGDAVVRYVFTYCFSTQEHTLPNDDFVLPVSCNWTTELTHYLKHGTPESDRRKVRSQSESSNPD